MMATPSANAVEMLDAMKRELEPSGWNVEFSFVTEERVAIRVAHPLSTENRLGFANDDRDHGDLVRRLTSEREFRVIADAPTQSSSESLIGKIRAAAVANHFEANVVEVLARVLQSERLLSDEDAKWLEEAGPAWSSAS